VYKIPYQDPHPDWTEVVIWWSDINAGPQYPIKEILEWIPDAPGGRYHLHGHNYTEGFAFRFERQEDATYFRLRWI
jgi:hypothetical protein